MHVCLPIQVLQAACLGLYAASLTHVAPFPSWLLYPQDGQRSEEVSAREGEKNEMAMPALIEGLEGAAAWVGSHSGPLPCAGIQQVCLIIDACEPPLTSMTPPNKQLQPLELHTQEAQE